MPIRPEQLLDHPAIHSVHTASFPTSVEARLVDALRAAGHLTLSLVAFERDEVIGHVAFSPITLATSPTVSNTAIGLAPVAVLPAFRKRGIAAALIREGLELCKQRGHDFCVVLGDPSYYGRFGFRPARDWALRDEYGGGDAFQALELQHDSIPTGGGLVRYAPEFAEFE